MSSLTASSTNSYTYGDSNWKDKLTSFNGNTITYDVIGNPLTYYNGYEFDWQNGRQLVSVSASDLSVSYKYNSDGIRTSKTVNGVTTTYTLEGSNIVKETNGTDTIWYYYDASGSLTGFELNDTPYFYVKNVQGDIVAITNASGDIVVEYTYNSWGKLISISGPGAGSLGTKNHFLYRGYYYDYELGLYYLNSRYYDPVTKRFINADEYASIGTKPNTSNAFTYCFNKPINAVDILGTHPSDLYPEYDTMDEAAYYASKYLGEYSFGEFTGNIYQDYYEYSICIYSIKKDGKKGYNFDLDTLHTDYSVDSVSAPDVNARFEGLYDAVAVVHTHPYSYSTSFISDNKILDSFSPKDKRVSDNMKKTMYVYTYTGKLMKYDPRLKKEETLSAEKYSLPAHKNYMVLNSVLGNIVNRTGLKYLR